MRARVLIAVFAAIALASRAYADGRDEARREYAAGEDADRDGHYDAAIEHYLRANELLPHPFNLYNIAVDYERLGRLRDAATWYRRYLDAAPASADHDRVARTVADLAGRPSSLSVRTLPEGAGVTIDGAPAGTTPLVAKLPGGTHHVVVDLAGKQATRDVVLAYGEPADVAFTLGGLAGTLSVGGAPPGAYVAVDDITIGVVPATTQISPGPHAVRVTAAGYTPYTTTANVAPNAETHVDAELVRLVPVAAPAGGTSSTVALVVGAGGGLELQGASPLGFAMIGTRISHYDLILRGGRAHGALDFDFVLRWSFLDGPIVPFAAIGYSSLSGGYGYLAFGGVRWDVSHSGGTVFSVVADGGVRVVPNNDSTSTAETVVIEPIELGAEVTFK